VFSVIVFIIYVVFFNWLVTCIPFIKNTGLPAGWITFLFSLKIIAGLFYAWFYLQPSYYATSDTWHYYEASKQETDWLLKEPLAFFKDLFTYGYHNSGNLFIGENSYWNDLKSNIVIKLLAIFNVFTFKNYFADIIFFNFLFFFGPVALYRLIQKLFPANKILLVGFIFLIPSFLFWCSGIHKDGLIFLSLALIAFHFQHQLEHKKINIQSFLFILFFIATLFALRNFMTFLLIPSLLVWWLCCRYPAKAKLIIGITYGAGLILFFLSGKISPQTDLPGYIIEKQVEFKKLSGNSEINVPMLEHNFSSFLEFFPSAIDIAVFRPHVTEIKNISYAPAVLEILFLWGIMLFSLVYRKQTKNSDTQKAFIIFCICFSVSFLLIAGYTITFSGAIVRYRSVILPLLFLPIFLNSRLATIQLPHTLK
jgi:hypothetical protein